MVYPESRKQIFSYQTNHECGGFVGRYEVSKTKNVL